MSFSVLMLFSICFFECVHFGKKLPGGDYGFSLSVALR